MMPMELNPKSVQRMMLSPRMLIAAHVLQLNILDLKAYLRLELEQNPLLEEETLREELDRDLVKFDEELTRLSERVKDDEAFYNEPMEEADVESRKRWSYLESLVVKRESLYDHLFWQLNVLAKNEKQKSIGRFLIENLDTQGYLQISLADAQNVLGESAETIKRVLSFIRTFDPVGVGARDLKESLLMQLISSGNTGSYVYKIVYFHLNDLAKGNYRKIAKKLKIPLKKVKEAKQRIARLEPKPGRPFSANAVVQIVPDVFLEKSNGSYNIQVNDKGLPRLNINRYYIKMLRDKTDDNKTIKYVRERFISAKWLLDAIKRRQQTIERVCLYLIEVQKDFLETGESGIKPLTLQDVAGGLSISEATVSRVVSNKYLQAPQRIYRLKQFFSGAIKQEGGGCIPDKYIKKRIEELIDNENGSKPLSDAGIVLLLKEEGVNIARRTVTKYREGLKLSSSRQRK
ncbi:MAG: RNA polymerase factor sigma-54 [Candidatus Omnitrophota bacterium]